MPVKNKIIVIMLVSIVSLMGLLTLNKPSGVENIEFKTISGATFDLQSLKGKPALITFWSTDCPSCIEEIPHLIELHQKYAKRGFKIIAVAMEYTPPNQVVAMTEAKQLPYDIVLDPNSTISHHFGDIRLTPTSFLFNPTGSIEKHIIGSFDQTELMQKLASFYGE